MGRRKIAQIAKKISGTNGLINILSALVDLEFVLRYSDFDSTLPRFCFRNSLMSYCPLLTSFVFSDLFAGPRHCRFKSELEYIIYKYIKPVNYFSYFKWGGGAKMGGGTS